MRALRSQSGQTAAEYMGMLLVVAAIIGALATSGLGDSVAKGAQRAICMIGGGGECAPGDATADAGGTSGADAEILQRASALDAWAAAQGGRAAELLEQARAALARGDQREADRLLDLLELYRRLQSGPRGQDVSDLASLSDEEFAARVADGNTYQEGGKYNRRYFQLDAAPGEGVLVYDYYIPFDSSVGLKGDSRGVSDPLLGEYGQDRSRITVIIDRETGRGVVVQTETCTVGVFGKAFCNEPRPITFDKGDDYDNDSGNDATGEGINIDKTNEFEIDADGDSVSLDYDALNSITPGGISVDGRVEINRQPDGTYAKGTDTRDDYPAKVIYHYPPGGEPYGIYDDKDINPDQVDGALPADPDLTTCRPPFADKPFVPDTVPCVDFE